MLTFTENVKAKTSGCLDRVLGRNEEPEQVQGLQVSLPQSRTPAGASDPALASISPWGGGFGSSLLAEEECPRRRAGVLGGVHTVGPSSPPCLHVPWLWSGKGWSLLSPRSFPGLVGWHVPVRVLSSLSLLPASTWLLKTIAEPGGALGG